MRNMPMTGTCQQFEWGNQAIENSFVRSLITKARFSHPQLIIDVRKIKMDGLVWPCWTGICCASIEPKLLSLIELFETCGSTSKEWTLLKPTCILRYTEMSKVGEILQIWNKILISIYTLRICNSVRLNCYPQTFQIKLNYYS